MKKLLFLVVSVLASTVAMAHIVMTVYVTNVYDNGDYQDSLHYAGSYYLDEISRIELFSSSNDYEHLGESGIRVYQYNYFTDFFASHVDSVTWTDYVEPGYGDFSCNLDSYEAVMARMSELYRSMNCFSNLDLGTEDWGVKLQLLFNSHPTLDTQAGGWDADFNNQRYYEKNEELNYFWRICYCAIFRCNQTISALDAITSVNTATRNQLVAEARTIRAFFYMQLATTFGRVPIFDTGEDHANSGTQRMRAENYQVMWDYIIADLQSASDVLDWQPRVAVRSSGNNGSMTKGIALAYLGDAYMWKAYRCPELASECYQLAAVALGKVIEEGPYQLNRSFTTLWDPIPLNTAVDFNPEAIYVQILEDATWGDDAPHSLSKFSMSCATNGGWGGLHLSWEWYAAYEKGDKRRDASCVTGNIPADLMDLYCFDYAAENHGVHPYLKEQIPVNSYDFDMTNHFKSPYELLPTIWSMKWWRNSKADWMSNPFCATNIYWKRLPNVMLDYAECLFNLGRNSEGWGLIDQLRQRAFGNLEVGYETEIANQYLPGMNTIFMKNHFFSHDTYPMPFNHEIVEVKDALDYYTTLKEQKGYDSPVWKVAVNEERRKEFNAEWCLRPDMERSGYLQDHIEHNYPQQISGNQKDVDYPWTFRTFTFDPDKMLFPIPIQELRRNSECDQNVGY